MIAYAESSAILGWLFGEEHGDGIRAILASADKVVTSRLTLIEVRRVLRRAVQDGRITGSEGSKLLALFAEASSTWAILEMTGEVAQRAEDTFPVEPVRTLDAIHLASAIRLRLSIADLAVVSTDDRIRANALQLGFHLEPAA